MDHRSKCERKKKLFRRNIKEYHHSLAIDKDFHTGEKNRKIIKHKPKIDKLDFIKIKNFCLLTHHCEWKGKPRSEDLFLIPITDKRLICISKEFLKINKYLKGWQPNPYKWAKKLSRQFTTRFSKDQ